MKWTQEDIDKAKNLLNYGKSYKEIAYILNRTEKSISKKNYKWKIKIGHNNNWTKIEEDKAIELLKNEESYKNIAKVLGKTINAIANRNWTKWRISVKKQSIWTEDDKKKVKGLLMEGHTCKEVSLILGKFSEDGISAMNVRRWKIDLLGRYLNNNWHGKNNPNYGAKIVKKGKDNPLSVWKREHPGYQDGEKNPSFGRVQSPEEIKQKTIKIREHNDYRKGKTLIEIYGKEIAEKMRQALIRSSVKRMATQKTSGTSIEILMTKILNSLNLRYEFQHPMDFYCVDFFIPFLKLVILTDGCYWHGHKCHLKSKELSEMQKNSIRRDKACNTFLTNREYKIFRIWECEMANAEEKLLPVLADLIKGKDIKTYTTTYISGDGLRDSLKALRDLKEISI